MAVEIMMVNTHVQLDQQTREAYNDSFHVKQHLIDHNNSTSKIVHVFSKGRQSIPLHLGSHYS